jgi:hypothetical protein
MLRSVVLASILLVIIEVGNARGDTIDTTLTATAPKLWKYMLTILSTSREWRRSPPSAPGETARKLDAIRKFTIA